MNTEKNPQSDVEDCIGVLIREQVDLRLPAPRTVPPFDPGQAEPETDHHRRPWLLALVAAACILSVAVGAFLVATLTHRTSTEPASPAPTPSANIVSLNGAQIVLPAGWVARDQKDKGILSDAFAKGWCLTPASRPLSAMDSCPLWLWLAGTDTALNPEHPVTSWFSNGHPCNDGYVDRDRGLRFEGGTRTFGGREAEWRHWIYQCSATKTLTIEQYVVPTAVPWILFAEQPNAAVRAAMQTVVTASQLPDQTRSLRLADHGIVRSIDAIPGGKRVTIDRTAGLEEPTNETRETFSYDVSSAVFVADEDDAGPIRVGKTASLQTNGRTVTVIYRAD